jgi:putative redox protein
MDAQVTWKNNLAFEGKSKRGTPVLLDTSVEQGGGSEGFSPMELLLVGLAGCTGMDVISILQKKRQDITQFRVQVHADRAEEHPKVFTKIIVEYVVTGNQVDRAAVERAVELSANKYCSASAMLSKAAEIEHRIILQDG